MKNLLFLITLILFFGCSTPSETWGEEVEGFKTINDFIDEFGEPIDVKEFDDSTEEWNNEVKIYNDRLSNKLSNQELLKLIKDWNQITIKQTFETYKETLKKYPHEISWGDYVTTKEYEWLEENLPYTEYSEKNKDRLIRSKFLSENLDSSLFWVPWVYNGTIELVQRNGLKVNMSKKTGLYLIGDPPKPEYKKEYKFFLGKSKYSDDFSDNDLPPSTELKWFGIVWENWDGSLITYSSSTEYEYINPYTICECMDNSDLTNNPLCQSMFRERYGTTVKNADNIQFETIKKDYDLNCN